MTHLKSEQRGFFVADSGLIPKMLTNGIGGVRADIRSATGH